jgi:hypothetical protein
MNDKIIVNPELIHLLSVDVLKARILSEYEAFKEESAEFQFSMSFLNGFNIAEKLVRCELEINVDRKNPEGRIIAESSYTLSFVYQIGNFGDAVEEKEGGIVLNNAMAATLAGIAFSTTRGILLTRFQGTMFKDFILPVIDPKKMLDDKVIQN